MFSHSSYLECGRILSPVLFLVTYVVHRFLLYRGVQCQAVSQVLVSLTHAHMNV